MAGLVQEYENVTVKRIDIVSWKSEAFAQIREAYGVNGIPYLRIYGTDGQLLGDGCLGPQQIRERIEAQAIRR